MNDVPLRRSRTEPHIIDSRDVLAIAVVAVTAGIIAVFSGAEPTGLMLVDWLLIAGSTSSVVWASASAHWSASAAVVVIASAIALQPVLAVLGIIVLFCSISLLARHRYHPALRALLAAVGMNLLIRSELGGFFGLSALVGITTATALLVSGARARPAVVARRALVVAASFGAVAAVSLVAAVVSAISARTDLSQGAREARLAIEALNSGDYKRGAELFADASLSFGSADRRLNGPFGQVGLLVPGVAQNISAAADLSAAASRATGEVASALEQIDVDTLRVSNGRIDIAAVRAVEAPLRSVQDSLIDLRTVTDQVRSPWLVAPVQRKLEELESDFDDNEPKLENAIEAVTLAPQLMGADRPRRYLLMFTSPAELRGITGFFGNYADFTIDDGQITINKFGRRSDLSEFVAENGATCRDCPEEFIDRYGRYDIAMGPDFKWGRYGWENSTMPAHFPYVAEAATVVYPQSGEQPIDGVIAIDPYVLQALMKYTGPIEVPEFDITIKPDKAAAFILRDQYLMAQRTEDFFDNESRIEALSTLGKLVIEKVLKGALPGPSQLAGDLGPLVVERRLLAWTQDPAEQALLNRIGMLGALPEMGDDGGFGFTVVNGGNNKIDVFLDRETDVRIENRSNGSRVLIADVTLINNAPANGLPAFVIGNRSDLPDGTSRMLVTMYGTEDLLTFLLDGQPVNYDEGTEAGWSTFSRTVDVGPGQSVNFHLEFTLGPPSDDVEEPVIWKQPIADRRA